MTAPDFNPLIKTCKSMSGTLLAGAHPVPNRSANVHPLNPALVGGGDAPVKTSAFDL